MPRLPVSAHDRQVPVQAVEQQIPCSQNPDWHSAAAAQVAMTGFLPQLVPLQVLGGLQSAGLAVVVQDGQAAGEGGIDSFLMALPEGVCATVRLTELVNPDRTVGFQPDIVVPRSAGDRSDPDPALAAALEALRGAAPSRRTGRRPASVFVPLRPEKAYREMEPPSREYRSHSAVAWRMRRIVALPY